MVVLSYSNAPFYIIKSVVLLLLLCHLPEKARDRESSVPELNILVLSALIPATVYR